MSDTGWRIPNYSETVTRGRQSAGSNRCEVLRIFVISLKAEMKSGMKAWASALPTTSQGFISFCTCSAAGISVACRLRS